MDTKPPSAASVAKHLELKPNTAERKSGYASAASMVSTIADKGVHTWTDEDGEQHTHDCWAVITCRGSKHYIAKSELSA